MPQMSPLLWLNLYFAFTATLVLFICVFFFTENPSEPPKSHNVYPSQETTLEW